MGTLRTPETEAAYTKVKEEGHLREGCVLCTIPSVKEFNEWRIIENRFPYDLIASVHHMILPKRHTAELSKSEQKEYEEIKETYMQPTYEFFIEPVNRQRSIPEHWHLHLITAKHTY